MSNTTHITIIHNGARVTGAEIRTPTRDIHINNAEDGKALEAMFYSDHGIDRYTGNAEGFDLC